MDPKFEYGVANGRVIAEVAELGCAKASKNARLSNWVAEGLQPLVELCGPQKDVHVKEYPFGYSLSRSVYLGWGKLEPDPATE
ncbi:hypothetical protein [Gemmatimonas sp.]|uniref:hypothetical protein n=1 Tax=Gemmatimonas sp. TaxID=1962908 RepID=UPI003F701751